MAESDLIRGNVDTLILKVLYEGDRYGYDLIKQINARSGGQWEIKQPTLYACLKRLEKQEFIKSYWDGSESGGGRRKYYTLTESGRQVFIKYKDEFERTRDLFGSLISDDDAMLPVDDFSDVEEESYAVPKRRPRPSKPRKKQEKNVEQPNISNEEYPQSFYDYTQSLTVTADGVAEKPETASADTTVTPVDEKPQEEVENEQTITEDNNDGFVQQSFFDSVTTDSHRDDAEILEDEPEEENTVTVEKELVSEPVIENKRTPLVPETADPKAIIDRLNSSYTGGESYASARARLPYEAVEYPERKPVATSTAVAPAPIVAPAPATAEKPEKITAPAREPRLPADTANDESLARMAYRDVLSELVDRCDRNVEESATEQAAAIATDDDRIEVRRFGEVVQTVTELGNEVQIRDHNDSAKVYTRKYYYYSNRLLMTHYMTMCAVMFILGLTLFLTFYVGLGMRMRYDYWLYIIAGLLPIVMFIAAVIVFVTDPDKRKRINVNFRSSIIIRIVIMLQVFVIIYAVNLMFKMPTGFSVEYIPSLLLPAVYALFIPLSEVIFMTLLKSGHYAVE